MQAGPVIQACRLAKERGSGSAMSANGMAMTKVDIVVAIVTNGDKVGSVAWGKRVRPGQLPKLGNRGYGHYGCRGYGSYSYPGGHVERERSPPPSAGATSSSGPIPPSHRPGANTRRSNSVTLENPALPKGSFVKKQCRSLTGPCAQSTHSLTAM